MKPFDPRLVRAVPQARAPLAALAVLGVVQGALTVATAFAVSALVVAVVDGADLGAEIVWTAVVFGLRAVAAWLSEGVSARVGVRVSTALREALLSAWGRRDADSRPERDTAVTLATSGANAVEPYAARYLPTLVTATVVPVLAVGTLAVVDWPSAVVVVLTLPLLPVFAVLIGRATAASTDRRWAALSALSGHFLDVVRGLPTLVGYGRAERQATVIRTVSERHRRATMQTLRIAFLSSAALELLATISVAIVAVTVGLRLSHGSMGLGAALVAILLAPEAYWPIRRVGAEFHAAADGAAALDTLLPQLGRELPQVARTRAVPVALRGVTYRYAGGLAPVVRDLTLVAGRGLTVLTGPSGVGKSTVLDLVAGLRRPTAGTVDAPSVHYVTQRPFLPAATIRDTLRLGAPAPAPDRGEHSSAGPDADLWAVLQRVGLDVLVGSLPKGLDTDVGDDGFGLSAGQRQRLVIARALLAPEQVILVDEPTANLDTASAETVVRVLQDMAEDRVVIAVTHDPRLVAAADEHVHLRTTSSDRAVHRRAPASLGTARSLDVSGRIEHWRSDRVRPAAARTECTVDQDGGRERRVAGAALLGGIASASGVALTATSGWLIVRAAERPVILTLLTAIVAVRTFGIARPVFRYWERLASHDAALAALAARREAAYVRLIPLTPARLGRRRRSDVLTAVVNDLTDESEAPVRVTVPVASAGLATAVAVGLSLAVSPSAALVIGAIGLAVALTCLVSLRIESAALPSVLAARAETNRVAELVTSQAGEVQAVNAWPTAMTWLDAAHAQLSAASRRAARARSLATGMLTAVVGAGTVAMALVSNGLGAPDTVKAMLVLVPLALSEAFAPLPEAMRARANAVAAARRTRELLGQAPAVGEPQQPVAADAHAIELEGVTAGWEPGHVAVGPVDLELRTGRSLAITGPNGSGKSTLLAVLARHLDPVSGRAAVRGPVAIVDDEPHVFATTLRNNLGLARPDASDAEIIEALYAAGLGELVASLPEGLDTRVGVDGRSLSGGERSRLAVARALLSERPVLLLDEPVAHLDPPTARLVLDDLLSVRAGRTVVLVTHRPEGLDRVDEVVELAPGGTATSPAEAGPAAYPLLEKVD